MEALRDHYADLVSEENNAKSSIQKEKLELLQQ